MAIEAGVGTMLNEHRTQVRVAFTTMVVVVRLCSSGGWTRRLTSTRSLVLIMLIASTICPGTWFCSHRTGCLGLFRFVSCGTSRTEWLVFDWVQIFPTDERCPYTTPLPHPYSSRPTHYPISMTRPRPTTGYYDCDKQYITDSSHKNSMHPHQP